jgi:hypothetical protein
MTEMVIGVDPDSDKHGVAIYLGGALVDLKMMSLVELRCWVAARVGVKSLLFSIENVLAQNFVYGRNAKSSKAAHAKVALSVGRCQQAQTELMRELDYLGIKYQLHNPSARNWAKNKALFEQRTGWDKKSNVDTRSAAYFGWLALQKGARHVGTNRR